jgi:mannosyltransferase
MPESSSARELRPATYVVAFTGLALLLRILFLTHKPFWQDEVFSVLFCRLPSAQFWSILKTAEANMGLYYLVLRPWMHWFSGDAGIRMLSVIPGVLTVPVVYALGKRLYSKSVGLWAAGLFAINGCAVVYSQEARGYSLLLFFVALSYWAFLRLVKDVSLANALIYVSVSAAAFYCHFYAVFVLLTHAVALLFLPERKSPLKTLLPCWIAIALLAVPGLRVALLSHGSNLWWLPKPGLVELYHTLTFLAAEDGKILGGVLAVFMLAPLALAIRKASRIMFAARKSDTSFLASIAPLGFLVPMIATFLLSFWRPMFFHRFLIICLVPFVLLVGAGLDGMKVRWCSTALSVGIVLLSLGACALSYTKVREDWRGAAAVTAGAGSAYPVIFYLKDASAPFAFYRERLDRPMTESQIIRLESPPTADQVKAWTSAYPDLWFVRFPAGPKDTMGPYVSIALQTAYRLCGERAFKSISVSWFSTGPCWRVP